MTSFGLVSIESDLFNAVKFLFFLISQRPDVTKNRFSAASSGFVNARLVMRMGMRAIIRAMYTAQIGTTTVLIIVTLTTDIYWLAFGAYVFWVLSNFFQAGLTIGNLNALGMEEMGHIAGLAASVIAAVSTVGAVIIAVPIALQFNGTPLPMAIGGLVCAILALWLTTKIKRPGEA